jgi:hypothetical protein
MGGNTNSNTVPENLKKLEALYEKLERDPNLEKAFLTDKNKFLEDHGFTEEEVNKLINDLQKSRLDELSSVLKEQEDKLN